ncbi:MAG: polysaccharide lyase family 8 super-sandwich domain-containing protein [Aestuariibaculum sp.]
MRHYLLFLLVFFIWANGNHKSFAQKVTVPLTNDGAWSVNSQPSAVYHNGKSYFSWVNKNKALVVASYEHANGVYQEKVVALSFRGDFASPALLVRANGQILLFASKNEGNANFFVWVSVSPEDITEWSASKQGTAYGAGATLPFAVGNDVYILYRRKDNVGLVYAAGLNASTAQTVDANLNARRRGIYGIGNGNDYTVKLDIPYMRACQSADGAMHIVFTQLASGGTNGNYYNYDKASVHYMKMVGTSSVATGIGFDLYKADGTGFDRGDISVPTPPDIIYSEADNGKKAWAYDIELDSNGNPVVLYATFNTDGTGHTYYQARRNNTNTEWISTQITEAGNGVPTLAYTANESKFPAHSYSSGGISFASTDLSTVYLSKRSTDNNFEIYKYETTDNGNTWQETEAVTTGTPSETINIRPKRVYNAPSNYPIDVVWMQGAYTSPVDFDTSIMCRGNAVSPTAMVFGEDTYNFVVNDEAELDVRFSPIFVADKTFTLESGNTNILEITPDNKIKCLAVGTVTVTAKSVANPSITASCQINVQERLVFDVFKERIVTDVIKEKTSGLEQPLDAEIASYLSLLQSDGSFSDIDYDSKVRTNWQPLEHVERLTLIALAYTTETSSYYQNGTLKSQIDTILQFWQDKKPSSNNWWYNQIAEPQEMGEFLILIDYLGVENIPEALLNTSIVRLRDRGGNPGAQTGANRVDVALHYMYRACLTKNYDLLQEAMDYIYSPIVLTTGSEGIQYDYSYTQHGKQLYTGSYGRVFLDGITKASMYAVDTDYAIPTEELDILSNLAKNSYANIFRGEYIYFNTIGRASTRPEATKKTDDTDIFVRMKAIDPVNAQVYNNVISRLTGNESPTYEVSPWSVHYYCSDYTLHNRTNYSVDLRMVSTRTVRNENAAGNGEGLKQYFLSDGATGIYVDGNEYYNIFPVWNWAKIPGVTSPEFTNIPQAPSYIKRGESQFVGGVTDSLNMVSVYDYKDTFSGIDTSAKKAWFFFDNEVVCLGSNIQSTSGLKVNTTVNQCLQDGNILVSSGGSTSTISTGNHTYSNNIDWVYHDKVGYYFPDEEGNIELTAQAQTGKWTDINTNYSNDDVTEDVFTLSFNHGTDPTDDKYAYIIVPGISQTEAQAYNTSNIEILVNSDSLQAVYNKSTKVYGLAFYKACSFVHNELKINVEKGCAMLVKDVDKTETIVYMADPKNGTTPINIGVATSAVPDQRLLTYTAAIPHLGRSLKLVVNDELPPYVNQNDFLDRTDWTIITSIDGPSDTTVGGDVKENIIDGDDISSFLFVKPGKTYGGITADADYVPSFTIDMKTPQDINYLVYRHRDYNNTTSPLRASRISFYGKNSETENFEPIIENVDIATDISDVRVDFQDVNYRYIKLVIEAWNETSGSTIQVSEFNVGYAITLNTGFNHENTRFSVYPNPVKSGQDLFVSLPNSENMVTVLEVFDAMGRLRQTYKQPIINTQNLSSGIYFVRVQGREATETIKFIVK